MDSWFFNLRCNYSNSITIILSKVGELYSRELNCWRPLSPLQCKIGHFHVVDLKWWKRNVKIVYRMCRARVVALCIKPRALSFKHTFSLPSPSSDLKVPKIILLQTYQANYLISDKWERWIISLWVGRGSLHHEGGLLKVATENLYFLLPLLNSVWYASLCFF